LKTLSCADGDHYALFYSNVKSLFGLVLLKVSSIPSALKRTVEGRENTNLPIVIRYCLHQKYDQTPEIALSQLSCSLGK